MARNPSLETYALEEFLYLRKNNPNVANVGGLQMQGVKGEVVALYFESLTTQKQKSSDVSVR